MGIGESVAWDSRAIRSPLSTSRFGIWSRRPRAFRSSSSGGRHRPHSGIWERWLSHVSVGGAKGSGLAMLFECLTSLFAGNPLLAPVFQGKPNADVHHQNSVVVAVDIASFTSVEEFRTNVDAIVEGIKALP